MCNQCEKLRIENERLRSELSIADLKTHKEKTLRILALLNECDTLMAKLAEVEAERDDIIENWQTMKRLHDELEAENAQLKRGISEVTGDKSSIFIQELNARYILPSDVAELLDREREAAKVMREALCSIEGGDARDEKEAGEIARTAIAKADEIRGGE